MGAAAVKNRPSVLRSVLCDFSVVAIVGFDPLNAELVFVVVESAQSLVLVICRVSSRKKELFACDAFDFSDRSDHVFDLAVEITAHVHAVFDSVVPQDAGCGFGYLDESLSEIVLIPAPTLFAFGAALYPSGDGIVEVGIDLLSDLFGW